MIRNRSNAPWKFMYLVRRICKRLDEGFSLKHTYRQTNKVVDALASLAYGVNTRME